MVSSHQALLFVTPLKKWEVNNPEAYEVVLVTQSQTITHLQTEGTELYTCFVGIVATENQHEIAIIGTHRLLHLCPHLRSIELIDRALHRSVSIELNIDQALRSYLRTLDKLGELIQLFTSIIGTTRDTDTTDIISFIEHRECTCSFQYIHQFYKLHTKAEIRFIGTKTTHRLMPSHTL